jgi:hypothetical protein
MAPAQMRQRLKKQIDALPQDKLRSASDYLAFLENQESHEATGEILAIPGIRNRIKQAEKDIASGKTTPWRKVQRHV